MAAWQGRKVFVAGEKLGSANLNALVDQSVMVFATATARDTAIPSPTEGMFAYTSDSHNLGVYNGTGWVPVVDGDGWSTYTPVITATTTSRPII